MSTIADVAKESNVSPSTVSLVANGNSRVSDDTRRRVESVMDRLNWRGRAAAKTKKHNIGIVYTPGMVVSGELVDYCCKWISSIRESFAEKNVDVTVSICQKHVEEDLMFLHHVQHGQLDGLVVMGEAKPANGYIDYAIENNLPLVVMGQQSDKAQFSHVCANTWDAGKLAVEHFLELGHQKIAQIIPRRNHDRAVGGLYTAFLDAMAERNIQPLDLTKHESLNFDKPDTFIPIAQKLMGAKVTACFTGDPIGMRLADCLEKLGVKVPENISILGWDDLGFTTARGQQLSSIGYDKRKMGLLAGQILQKLIKEKGNIHNLTATVPVQLNDGDTTAPAPNSVATNRKHQEAEKYSGRAGVSPAVPAQQEAIDTETADLSPYEQLEEQTYSKQEKPESVEV